MAGGLRGSGQVYETYSTLRDKLDDLNFLLFIRTISICSEYELNL